MNCLWHAVLKSLRQLVAGGTTRTTLRGVRRPYLPGGDGPRTVGIVIGVTAVLLLGRCCAHPIVAILSGRVLGERGVLCRRCREPSQGVLVLRRLPPQVIHVGQLVGEKEASGNPRTGLALGHGGGSGAIETRPGVVHKVRAPCVVGATILPLVVRTVHERLDMPRSLSAVRPRPRLLRADFPRGAVATPRTPPRRVRTLTTARPV
mmetsp:Transcript_28200/g.78867  ORF Transcript_28200/g.78867 Transcript_28200/m.78867 type:complete len:206 (+) Transcript_28200:1146-1763(+)